MDWIDDRSGIRGLVKEALYEKVPGGARWRYVWGSCLTFVFFTQVVTGTLLWMFYAPSAQTAWESVYFLQYHVAGGWFLRGVHHYMAQAMIVLLVLHLMQVVIDGAYKAPRELNFWFGILMMGVTLALSLTGYLLPWDQKGYSATAVATNLMAEVPLHRNGSSEDRSRRVGIRSSYSYPFLCPPCRCSACYFGRFGGRSYLSVPKARYPCKGTKTQA